MKPTTTSEGPPMRKEEAYEQQFVKGRLFLETGVLTIDHGRNPQAQ